MSSRSSFAFPPYLLEEPFSETEWGSCLICYEDVPRDVPRDGDHEACAKRAVLLKNYLFHFGYDLSFIPDECSQKDYPLCQAHEELLEKMWKKYCEVLDIGIGLQKAVVNRVLEKKKYVPKQEDGNFTKLREIVVTGALCNSFGEPESDPKRFLQRILKLAEYKSIFAKSSRNGTTASGGNGNVEGTMATEADGMPPSFPAQSSLSTPTDPAADLAPPPPPFPTPLNVGGPLEPTDFNNRATETFVPAYNDLIRNTSLMTHETNRIFAPIFTDGTTFLGGNGSVGTVGSQADGRPTSVASQSTGLALGNTPVPPSRPFCPRRFFNSLNAIGETASGSYYFIPSEPMESEDGTGTVSSMRFSYCNNCKVILTGQKEYEEHKRQCLASSHFTSTNAAEASKTLLRVPLVTEKTLNAFARSASGLPPLRHFAEFKLTDSTSGSSFLRLTQCKNCSFVSLGQQDYERHLSQCSSSRGSTNRRNAQKLGKDKRKADAIKSGRINKPRRYDCRFCAKTYKSKQYKDIHEGEVHGLYGTQHGDSPVVQNVSLLRSELPISSLAASSNQLPSATIHHAPQRPPMMTPLPNLNNWMNPGAGTGNRMPAGMPPYLSSQAGLGPLPSGSYNLDGHLPFLSARQASLPSTLTSSSVRDFQFPN